MGCFRNAVFAALAVVVIGGCSTTIKTTSEAPDTTQPEREALAQAAAGVAWTPWPKPTSSTLAEVLVGAPTAEKDFSRDDAIDAYVATLASTPDAQAAISGDVRRHLAAAATLNAAAREACDASSPRLSDVALVEDSIAELREMRAIYVATLKKIDADKDVSDKLKRAFDAALKDLGKVADDLAESAVKSRADLYTGKVASYAAPRS